MKYIIMVTDDGANLPFIFPERMTHSMFANFVALAIGREHNTSSKPISAGLIHIAKCRTHGGSETLHLDSRAIDSARIMMGGSVEFTPDEQTFKLFKQLGIKP